MMEPVCMFGGGGARCEGVHWGTRGEGYTGGLGVRGYTGGQV